MNTSVTVTITQTDDGVHIFNRISKINIRARTLAQALVELDKQISVPPIPWPVGTILRSNNGDWSVKMLVRVVGLGYTQGTFAGEVVRSGGNPVPMTVGEVSDSFIIRGSWEVVE